MDRAGILKKYGLTRPVAGDAPHVELAGARNGYNTTVNAKPSSDMVAANSDDRYNQMVNNNPNDLDDTNYNEESAQLLARILSVNEEQLKAIRNS
jgi:hypothetical protein